MRIARLRTAALFLKPIPLLCLALAFASSAAGQETTPTVLVETFENPANYNESTIGNALTDMFVTELARAGRFRVLDSSAGGNDAADLIFRAKVTNFSYEEIDLGYVTTRSGQRTGEKMYQQNTEVRIDFRVVDPLSGEVIFADAGEARHSNTSVASFDADFRSMVASSASIRELLNSMMGQASGKAIDMAIRRMNDYFDIVGFESAALEGIVAGIAGDQTVVIDLGQQDGLEPGDALQVFRESPITNSEGEVVYTTREEVAEVEVVETQTAGSLARLRAGADVQEGDLVVREATVIDLAARLDRGWRLLERSFYSPASQEFQAALEDDPTSSEAINGAAWADLYLRRFPEAFAAWDELLINGSVLEFPVHHHHSFNFNCDGVLLLSSESISFPAPMGEEAKHGFDVSIAEVREVELKSDHVGFKAPNNVENDEKSWNFEVLLAGSESLERSRGYIAYPAQTAEIERELLGYVAARLSGSR